MHNSFIHAMVSNELHMIVSYPFYRQNELFWTDVQERVIVRSSLDGTNAVLLVNNDLSYPGNYCIIFMPHSIV